MPVEVIMPKVDMDMAAGKVAAWHVQEGRQVEKGAPLFDIETDKAAMEVESPASGTLRHISVAVGAEIPIGAVIAWIYAEGEADAPPPVTPSPSASTSALASPDRTANADEHATPTTPVAAAALREPPTPAGAIRATPAARRAAREADLDLRSLIGSGPKGRIQAVDVDSARALSNDAATLRAPATRTPTWAPEPGPLFTFERGAGAATPIFMVHGFAADAYTWAALEPHLPADRRMLQLELPSHGRSPKRRIATFSALSRSIVETLDATGLSKVHLVGHSLGGALCLALADIRPRMVASLSLIAPAGLGAEIDGATVSGIASASRSESLGPWLRRLTATPLFLNDDFIDAAMMARTNPALRAAQIDLAHALFPDSTQSFDLRAALGRITAPTALIWGKQDAVVPWRHALAAPGRVALHLMEDAGHIPHIETAQSVGEIIARQIRASEPS